MFQIWNRVPCQIICPQALGSKVCSLCFISQKQRIHPTDHIFYLLSVQIPCLLLALHAGFLPCAFFPSFSPHHLPQLIRRHGDLTHSTGTVVSAILCHFLFPHTPWQLSGGQREGSACRSTSIETTADRPARRTWL